MKTSTKDIIEASAVFMTEFNSIEKQIKEVLEDYSSNGIANDYGNNTHWTTEIKKVVGKVGIDNKCEVCAHNLGSEFPHEWLYDLVWYKMSEPEKNGIMTNLELAMECEWSPLQWEIQKDFEKLLQTNAAHRLMVCNVKKNDKQEVWDYFNKAITNYKNGHSGDRFMIAMMDADYKFEFKLFIK